MATKLNPDGILLLEQPFARVPFENYRKVFRTHQKHVERELGAVQSAAHDLSKRSKSGVIEESDVVASIDAMIGRVETLKRKLSDLHTNAGKPTQEVMRERFQHLATVETLADPSCPEFNRWADTRLDRWLVDWALRNGKEKTARRIASEKGIETLVDIDLFSDISRIEGDLERHSCTAALNWCSENKSALRKLKNSSLEFDLRMQEYIELCRIGKNAEAMTYSAKYLTPWQESHLQQILQASALLAFPPSTKCKPYKALYDKSRWLDLSKQFRRSIYSLNSLPDEPLLNLSLYAGISALKLPACREHSTRNVDCPICDLESGYDGPGRGLGKLAEEVPRSHHPNSTIVCLITGKIMDQDNMPMAFPVGGNVYSREAMEDMAAKNGGKVTCPRAHVTCDFSDLRKVFIS